MRSPPDPFLRPDSVRYDDIVADGFVELLRSRGIDGLTMKDLAAWMRVTPSAVTHRGKWPATVEHFASAMTRRWVQWSMGGFRRTPPVPALPTTHAERHGVRCWYLVHELARTEAAAGRPAALEWWQEGMRAEEDELQAWWLARGGQGRTYDRFRLVLSGMRLALALDPTLSAAAAREVLLAATSTRIEGDARLNSN